MEWIDIFNLESQKDYFKNLKTFIDEEYQNYEIYPSKDNIFKAFDLVSFNDVKVVILGQDPYHEEGQAMGLAFSVPSNIKLPPSLKNIYKELKDDLGINKNNGDLTSWANQGVLLLNTTLTVRAHKPLSHYKKGWEEFTDNIIKYLNKSNTPKVFILWGNNAILKSKFITNSNHLVIKSPHPSSLSAYQGFFGSKCFSKTNIFLIKNNIKPIEW